METKPAVYSLSIGRMLALLVHYFAGYLYVYRIVATKITLAVQPGATILLPWVQLLIYVFTAGVAILLAWPVLRDSWMKFRRNTGANLKMSAYLIVVILAVNMLLSLLIGLLTQTGNSVNQEEIRNASTVLPLMTILSTCVFAPIIEETVFRAGAFSCLRSRIGFWTAAIISSILFGYIHIVDSLLAGNLVDVSYLLVYAGIGMVLAYGYEKSSSCLVPGMVHAGNNIISMLFMLL